MYSAVERNWSTLLWMSLRTHKHVLVVDDSFTVRQSLKRYLSSRGDVVVCGEAVNGREAVQRAMALQPDLVLLDLAMPEMNGAEVASVLKGAMPDIHVILFTMFGENIGKCLLFMEVHYANLLQDHLTGEYNVQCRTPEKRGPLPPSRGQSRVIRGLRAQLPCPFQNGRNQFLIEVTFIQQRIRSEVVSQNIRFLILPNRDHQ